MSLIRIEERGLDIDAFADSLEPLDDPRAVAAGPRLDGAHHTVDERAGLVTWLA